MILIVRVDFDTMENHVGAAIHETVIGVTEDEDLADRLVEKYRRKNPGKKVWGSWDDYDLYPRFSARKIPTIGAPMLERSCSGGHFWGPRTDLDSGWAVCPACGLVTFLVSGKEGAGS